jgi:hypothetical protein
MTAIYSKATSEERTEILQEGLLQLATLVNPKTATEWATVRKDADRLMRLWGVKESDPVATEMATQLLEMIGDFTAGADDVALVIEEKEAPVEPPPVPVVATPATVLYSPPAVFPEEAATAAVPNIKVVVIEEHPATAVEAGDLEPEAVVDEGNAEEDEEPSGCLAAATLDNIEGDEDNEEDDDDNDGVEVQKIFFKGRGYWLGSDNKIYACADDDEIGEEIGDYNPAEKKPRFY